MGQQIKSKQRVAEHGEVFTAEREVKAMCGLVNDKCRDIKATFLEPACGEGNFLVEILSRKLQTIEENYHDNFSECERQSLIALSSLYGIDIQEDNVEKCRENLFDLWKNFLEKNGRISDDIAKSANFILEKNIVCGDTINGAEKIFFSEWLFLDDKINVQRIEKSLDLIIRENDPNYQPDLFDISKTYKAADYRRLFNEQNF